MEPDFSKSTQTSEKFGRNNPETEERLQPIETMTTAEFLTSLGILAFVAIFAVPAAWDILQSIL